MADPICRWRNPYIPTVLKLIELLPKYEQSEENARSYIKQSYEGDFFRTPYQLACQLGLYYFTNGYYFPKFTRIPNESEIQKYLENWLIHYTVPNPYTGSIPEHVEPFSLHGKICEELLNREDSLSLNNILDTIFGVDSGNLDILANMLKEYSPVLATQKVEDRKFIVNLKDDKTYSDLVPYVNVEACPVRDNKEYFFDLFKLPSEIDISNDFSLLVTDDEASILSELDSSNLSSTEKYQIAKSRIGQGKFRRLLIEEGVFCPFTLINDPRLLIASHIKPWRNSNNVERLDPKNGLLFTPTYDMLFDKGWISFTESKELMISNKLDRMNVTKLRIESNMIIPNIDIEDRSEYLAYHRNNVYLGH